MFEKTLAHERIVTARINKLMDLARKESDHATEVMLGWFVNEQVEEEAAAAEMLQTLTLAGTDMSGLLMIDKDLGARVFTPPVGLVIG
jgi:ferritin